MNSILVKAALLSSLSIAVTAGLAQAESGAFDPSVTLWYDTEVKDWRDALPMGNVVLHFPAEAGVSGYRRSLDLRTGISRVVYRQNGVNYVREVFVSQPDQVIVMRLAADQPKAVSFDGELRGVRNQAHSNYATDYFHMDVWGDNGLVLTGKSADYLGVAGKLRYEARLLVRARGGQVRTNVKSLRVEGADEVVLLLVAATNFKSYKEVSGDGATRVRRYLAPLAQRDYERIKQDHVQDHQALFHRVTLALPPGQNSFLPTDVRLKKAKEEPDPALAALAFQYSRYLMMAASRPGTQAANLQGVWNDEANPKWDAKYTVNINLQMNYWSVDSSNLRECAQPLFDLLRDLPSQGRRTARELYGVKRGWVCHQKTDLSRQTTPMDGSNWGGFTTAGAWLCTHIWEHFQYTGDRAESILNGCFSEQCFKSLFSNCSDAMQVDGAFGVGAGITEMLMQSHEGYIELLPAVPKHWANGRFSGVVARGAFELDYAWVDGQVTALTYFPGRVIPAN
jgi:alpha-L-fucosidase 2